MRRAPLFILVVTLVIVAGVGGALAATHGKSTPVSAPAESGAGVTSPTIEGDVTPDQPAAKTATKATPKPKSHSASREATALNAAATTPHPSLSGDEKDCWDDCGSSASGAASTVGIDDDRDGDGGDCGEGD